MSKGVSPQLIVNHTCKPSGYKRLCIIAEGPMQFGGLSETLITETLNHFSKDQTDCLHKLTPWLSKPSFAFWLQKLCPVEQGPSKRQKTKRANFDLLSTTLLSYIISFLNNPQTFGEITYQWRLLDCENDPDNWSVFNLLMAKKSFYEGCSAYFANKTLRIRSTYLNAIQPFNVQKLLVHHGVCIGKRKYNPSKVLNNSNCLFDCACMSTECFRNCRHPNFVRDDALLLQNQPLLKHLHLRIFLETSLDSLTQLQTLMLSKGFKKNIMLPSTLLHLEIAKSTQPLRGIYPAVKFLVWPHSRFSATQFPALERLYLDCELVPLQFPTTLRSVNLIDSSYGSGSKNIFTGFNTCPHLTELNIHSYGVYDLKPLAGITSLTTLTLRAPKLADISAIVALQRLETFILKRGVILAKIDALIELPVLKEFRLEFCDQVVLAPLAKASASLKLVSRTGFTALFQPSIFLDFMLLKELRPDMAVVLLDADDKFKNWSGK